MYNISHSSHQCSLTLNFSMQNSQQFAFLDNDKNYISFLETKLIESQSNQLFENVSLHIFKSQVLSAAQLDNSSQLFRERNIFIILQFDSNQELEFQYYNSDIFKDLQKLSLMRRQRDL